MLLTIDMYSSITPHCFVERETGLILDMVGNRLLVGSVIVYKLTIFFIMKDGAIDYMGDGKMEMVYWADDEYFEFLYQQVKDLHMERSQGLITSVYRALTGSRYKNRRRQVTGIPPTPVTIELQTPATQNKSPSGKHWRRTQPRMSLGVNDKLTRRRFLKRSQPQTTTWENHMWWRFSEVVNMFL